MNYLLVGACYLLGSVSFGYLLGKLWKGVDIRRYGSGSSGATNTLRTLGPKLALATFLLDALKGAATVFIAQSLGTAPWATPACVIAVVIGHNWPVFFRFKGGRGAATTLGVMFALLFWTTLVAFLIIVVIIAVTRYVSLASILGGLAIPIALWLAGFEGRYILMGVILGALIIIRHYGNIRRLLAGTEQKIGKKVSMPNNE